MSDLGFTMTEQVDLDVADAHRNATEVRRVRALLQSRGLTAYWRLDIAVDVLLRRRDADPVLDAGWPREVGR